MDPRILRPEARLFYADTVHERIEEQINSAIRKLKEGQSLFVEVILQDRRVILPTYFGYHNPSFIIVYGEDANKNEIKALIPHTAIQIVMTVMNKPAAEKRRIGFQSREGNPEV